MSYIIMATGEDGMEFRATDEEYDSQEQAHCHLCEAIERWPDAELSIEEFQGMAFYHDVWQDRFEKDTADLF